MGERVALQPVDAADVTIVVDKAKLPQPYLHSNVGMRLHVAAARGQ
jgi:hypothetical protein